jgi:hypothetical protein
VAEVHILLGGFVFLKKRFLSYPHCIRTTKKHDFYLFSLAGLFWPVEIIEKSSQVKLLITNNAFCIVQRAKAQSITGIFLDCGVAEAPPGFQAGWSYCMHYSLCFCSFCLLIWK